MTHALLRSMPALLVLLSVGCGELPFPSLDDASYDGSLDGGSLDAGPGTCSGSPVTCAEVPSLACFAVVGCTTDAECTGLPSRCDRLSSSSRCRDQLGCRWNDLNATCEGSVLPCDLEITVSGCARREGCRWSQTCEGEIDGCEAQGGWACERISGCTWTPDP